MIFSEVFSKMEIRVFPNGSLYGVKTAAWAYNRMGYDVATIGGYQPNNRAFRVNWLSPEGVAGSNQVLRFENID